MNQSIARISVAISGVLFVTGFGVLCACPGWFALAAVFAGVAVWVGKGWTRKWAVLFFVAALICTGWDTLALIREHHRH